jgi:hypothetical protein
MTIMERRGVQPTTSPGSKFTAVSKVGGTPIPDSQPH